MLEIKTFKININNTGHITNTYLLFSNKTKTAILFDPAGDENIILDFINNNKLNLKYIIITHCHGDHICGIDKIKDETNAIIVTSINEEKGYYTDSINCCTYLELKIPKSKIDMTVENEQILAVDDITLKFVFTPGHTIGSMCIYCEDLNILFSGDTIFSDCYGRTDLETGSFEDMKNSLNFLFENYGDVIIYPGHGKSAIINDIRRKLTLLMKIKQNNK